MSGEIANAYITIVPSMKGFGTSAVQQIGPGMRSASTKIGAESGAALGQAFGTSAGAASQNFFLRSAQMAIKNVALYGSMYAAIQGLRVGIKDMFGDMVGFNAELEQADIGFTTLLKSQSAARDQMAWIKSFAKETPFRYDNLVNYSQQLIALGFNAEESRKVLTAAGDAAAALGRGDQSIERINLALGQMWTKGKVQSQEMLQLTEAGIGAWQILADAYGSTVADVQDRVTRGLITAKEAVPALVAGMEDQFGGLMDKQAETFSGVWSNIQDTIQQQLAEAGEPLFAQLKDAGQEFLSSLDDPAVKEILDGFGQNLADTAKVLLQSGEAAAGAFKDALPFMRDVFSNAKESLPVLVALAAAFLVARKASEGGVGVGFLRGVIKDSRLAAAAVTSVTVPTKAMVAAQQAAVGASVKLGAAQYAEAQAAAAAKLATESSTSAYTKDTVAVTAATAARGELAAASLARSAANAELVASEAAVTAATEKAIASQQRMAALRAGFGRFSGLAQMAGLGIGIASITSLGDASESAEQKVLGVVGALGAGALVGATFGGVAGAAIGSVVGLTAALVQLQQAQDAANKDTSETAKALEGIGVSASTATTLLANFTNAQLESVGGSKAVISAVQHGGAEYDELITKLTAARDAQLELAASADKTSHSLANPRGANVSGATAGRAREEAERLAQALDGLKESATESAYSQFLAQEATQAATGSYGELSRVAYESALALGAIPPAMAQTGVAAEGASGKVGYLIAALTGIPVNTSINFNTNASEILQKIIALQAAATANFGSMGMTADGYLRRLNSLKAQAAAALQDFSVRPTLSLPSYGGSGAGRAIADSVNNAAKEAAAQLKRDRNAQLQFADAFGALMESALTGEFDRYREKLADQIKSLTRDGYAKAADELSRLSVTLNQAALDYGALTNKIKAATDAETDLTKRMQNQYQSTVDLITGLGKATDAQSFDQLAYLLGETTSAATQYQDVLQQLKSEGLSADLWNQLAQAGPQSMGLAQSILAQGQSGIDQLNSLSGSLVDAADSMGDLVSQSMYQQGVDAMQAYIDGLQSQAQALENQMVTIGNNVLTKTAGAITPGNAGYTPIVSGTQTTTNTYNLSITAESLGDIKSVQDFIAMLESAPTTRLVDAAGKVVS